MNNFNQKKKQETFLVKTNQVWKLWFLIVLGGIELVLLILMVSSIVNPDSYLLAKYRIGELETRTVVLLLGLVFLYSLFCLIKCPSCHKKPVYKIIKESNINEWMISAINFKNCPYCNYPDNN